VEEMAKKKSKATGQHIERKKRARRERKWGRESCAKENEKRLHARACVSLSCRLARGSVTGPFNLELFALLCISYSFALFFHSQFLHIFITLKIISPAISAIPSSDKYADAKVKVCVTAF
jgi:hypothetical protein